MKTYKELLEKWIGARRSVQQGSRQYLKNYGKTNFGTRIHDYGNIFDDEIKSLHHYSNEGYDSINRHLRHNSKFPAHPAIQEHINNIDYAIHKHETKHDMHVYRSLGWHDPEMKPGDIYHDRGFVSTTLNNHWGTGTGHLIHIKVPKGSKALYLNQRSLSKHFGEQEVLLPRNAKFRYEGSEKVKDKYNQEGTLHHMTYLGTHHEDT
jgi:hypothetical protein